MDWIWFTGIVIGGWALLRLIGNERQAQIAVMEHRFRIQQQFAEIAQQAESSRGATPTPKASAPKPQPMSPAPNKAPAKPAAKK